MSVVGMPLTYEGTMQLTRVCTHDTSARLLELTVEQIRDTSGNCRNTSFAISTSTLKMLEVAILSMKVIGSYSNPAFLLDRGY